MADMISQQTLQEFLDRPFGLPNEQKHLQYEDRYQSYKKGNHIKVEATMELDKNYFIHLRVPSESQKGLSYYDVVVQFFTPNKEVETQLSIKNYYVQFFSNSPGFIYKYAALYKMNGYLIESLLDKFSPGMLDVLPDKANKTYELYFDSSIYYACRYILDNRLTIFGKLNFKILKKKSPSAFFAGIQDSEEAEINRNVAMIENQMKKEIHSDTRLGISKEKTKRDRTKTSTNKNKNHSSIVVKKATSRTSKGVSSITVKKPKRTTTKGS